MIHSVVVIIMIHSVVSIMMIHSVVSWHSQPGLPPHCFQGEHDDEYDNDEEKLVMIFDDEHLKGATRQGAGEVIQTRAGQVFFADLIFIPRLAQRQAIV